MAPELGERCAGVRGVLGWGSELTERAHIIAGEGSRHVMRCRGQSRRRAAGGVKPTRSTAPASDRDPTNGDHAQKPGKPAYHLILLAPLRLSPQTIPCEAISATSNIDGETRRPPRFVDLVSWNGKTDRVASRRDWIDLGLSSPQPAAAFAIDQHFVTSEKILEDRSPRDSNSRTAHHWSYHPQTTEGARNADYFRCPGAGVDPLMWTLHSGCGQGRSPDGSTVEVSG
jgi:hypothetical protein